MAHSPKLLTPAQCLLQAMMGQRTGRACFLATRHAVTRRTYFDPRRIASANIPQAVDKLAEFKRDEQIDTPTVQIKLVEEGKLEEPQPLQQILRSINRETHCVVQLSKPGERDAAVVEIKSKMDLLKQLRDKQNQLRQAELAKREKKPKQIELNWAISENDLNLKLRQMEDFLQKGKTVEVILAAKKRQRKASEEEGSNVLNKIKQIILDVGAREIKPMQGQLLKQTTLIIKK